MGSAEIPFGGDLGVHRGRTAESDGGWAHFIETPGVRCGREAVKHVSARTSVIGADPTRAESIDFTAAYVEIEVTYLVPNDSPF